MWNTSSYQNDWTPNQEALLKTWYDKARVYAWLHAQSHAYFKKLNYAFAIPCILLSTFSGSANFMLSGGGEDDGPSATTSMTLGVVNLFTAMLMSTNQFLKLAESADRHKTLSVGYGKFVRNVNAQLSLDSADREPGIQFVMSCQKDIDGLIEQSPDIPENVLKRFHREFDHDASMTLPDIVGRAGDEAEPRVSVAI